MTWSCDCHVTWSCDTVYTVHQGHSQPLVEYLHHSDWLTMGWYVPSSNNRFSSANLKRGQQRTHAPHAAQTLEKQHPMAHVLDWCTGTWQIEFTTALHIMECTGLRWLSVRTVPYVCTLSHTYACAHGRFHAYLTNSTATQLLGYLLYRALRH